MSLPTSTSTTPTHCQLYRFLSYANIQNRTKRLGPLLLVTTIVWGWYFCYSVRLVLLVLLLLYLGARARAHTHTHTHAGTHTHTQTCCVCLKKRQVEVIPSVLCFYTQHNKTQGACTTCRPIWKCLALPLTVSSRLQTHIIGLLYFPTLDILLYLQLAPSHLNLILLNT